MTFSDDDLAELKELIKASVYWSPKIPALLARLEAAERVIYHAGLIRGPGTDALMDDWRKVVGKCP